MIVFTCFCYWSPSGSQTRERGGSFPEYLLFTVPLAGEKEEGCRESSDSAMPYRACALGGLPGAGYLCTENTEEGHALHTLMQKEQRDRMC